MIPRGVRRAALSWLPLVLGGCNLIFSYREAARGTEAGAADVARDVPHSETGVGEGLDDSRAPDIGPPVDFMTGIPDPGKPDAPGTCWVGGKQGTWTCPTDPKSSLCKGECKLEPSSDSVVVDCTPARRVGAASCDCGGVAVMVEINPSDLCETCRDALAQCTRPDGGPTP
jgi:hypothetical protein